MTISITTRFAFRADVPTDVLLQFEAAPMAEQHLRDCETHFSDPGEIFRIPAQDAIGERIWARVEGRLEVGYTATVEIERIATDMAALRQLEPRQLPGAAVPYLFDSRFCPADRFQSFVASEFRGSAGGELILAMRDWIAQRFAYTPGASGPATTALDSFVERQGVCRDYAHMLVTFARAAGIPARFVSCYAPHVTPQDFHAVAEVFLTDPHAAQDADVFGSWFLVDATGMAGPGDIVTIGVGRDAADVSFLTSFGPTEFLDKQIEVYA